MTDPDTHVHVLNGFVPFVSGTEILMQQAGSVAVVSTGSVAVENGGAPLVLANGEVSFANGGAQTVIANGNVEIEQGGALVAVARRVEIRSGVLGIALSPNIALNDSKVVIGPRAALIVGAGLAIGLGLLARARAAINPSDA